MENSMDVKIVTSDALKERVVENLGFNQPTAFDTVDRSRFASDEAYLDALTAETLKRDDAEFRRTRSRLAAEYRARQEQAQQEAQAAVYKEIRATVSLDPLDTREIDAEAAELARRDLSAGRIGASGLGAKIEEYAKALGEKRKDAKANSQLFNAMLRGQR